MVPRDRRLVVVLSPKGGTGKTTISTNLAVGLARRHPGEVVLADLDLAFGDVAAALLLSTRRGIRDLHRGLPLDDVLVEHPTGLQVLGAPDEAMPTDTDVGDLVGPVLDALADRYRLVVTDTGAGFDAVTRAAVSRATDIVLVASMDVPTLLGLRKVIGWLDGLGHVDARRHLVLNRANAQVGLVLDDVTATTGLPIAVTIPSDAAVTQSVNEGQPLTASDAGGPAADAFAELIELVAPVDPLRRSEPAGWVQRMLSRGGLGDRDD